ncbi:MAG: hypothetical protein QGG98_03165 [Pseudomonadales bacterium]|nr:hypothetical protein [Arenicellales bacterium]MDP6264236.1 hypothetical protein [Pseudomonadales bacterium]|tara:strand:- start:4454 stop:5296 length:843 start_codon:yes stop_codon:yes gene_type:complete
MSDQVIFTAPSITKLPENIAGRVLVSGSHGGIYPAYLAARSGVRGVVFNDAGGGCDDAGFASLPYLDNLGIPAATCSHLSACIGDGKDMMGRGKISRVNLVAAQLGSSVGQSVSETAGLMTFAGLRRFEAPVYQESRVCFLETGAEPGVWGIDSASLVQSGDIDQIIVTGSHGGLLGNDPATAIRVQVAACAFNDAGVGIDRVGITRLPVLNERGIAAVTVDCMSARIGDARSMWETGKISYVNQVSRAMGIAPGQSLPVFAEKVRRAIRHTQNRQPETI